MKQKKRSEYISEFLAFLEQTTRDYDFALIGEKQQNDLTQDLLHQLELDGEQSYPDRCKLVTVLRKNRQKRRGYKDTIEETEVIINYTSDNKKAVELLKQLLGKVRKAESYHENRVYKPRIKR